MKIIRVEANNRKRAFEVHVGKRVLLLPYAAIRPTPSTKNRIVGIAVDSDMGNEGFIYRLASGKEGVVHIDHVLEYNKDPVFMKEEALYRMTLVAQKAVKSSPLGVRELTRRLKTSPAQFYRLLDQTNYNKSLMQMIELLVLLNQEVGISVRPRSRAKDAHTFWFSTTS